MQTIEKALHQPMPFTTGGQTISDRLTAAKHSLAGSQLGKTICKATTEEIMAPKKKHLDYLLHCTNEPNVSVPSMANLLIERTQNPNWTVVYKALITIHNIMCYGNERFSQYLASCNTTFNLTAFVDKNSAAGGYDMSTHVRRYAKYISEKINTYRMCAFDFCKVKRGREDGLLRTMHTDKLLKTIPILQNQIDALLEFQVTSSELVNGVINCSFILLFRDLIRLFACYNDGIINVLEKYFDMHKKQCRDALDTYKSFLTRLDKVAEFLRVAESVGIDRGEIPDLTRAPASLLEALEAHLIQMEGGRAPAPAHTQQVQQQVASFSFSQQPNVAEAERQRYVDLENARLSQFREEQEQKKSLTSANPFAPDVAPQSTGSVPAATTDLLDWNNVAPAGSSDTNPFAAITNQPTYQNTSIAPNVGYGGQQNGAGAQPFFGNIHQTNEIGENPFAVASAQPVHHAPAPPVPPPPSNASMVAAHQVSNAAPINPFADQMLFGQAPPIDQGHPFQPFNPSNQDDLARMAQQMSLNQQPGAWNQTSAASNPFNAPQPGYSTAMGGYPQQYVPQQMWQNPYGQTQFSYQPGQLPPQQQQQINFVNQIKQQQNQQQQQQQAQAAVNTNDLF